MARKFWEDSVNLLIHPFTLTQHIRTMPIAHSRYARMNVWRVTTMMRPLSMREPLPDRRRSWTQEVTIEGQNICLTVGEYADGRPGEIWIDVSKEGSFLRGVMGVLSRTISISLQCGADLEAMCHSLRAIDYPPNGQVIPVNGCTSKVAECYSVTDWVASELEDRYLTNKEEPNVEVSSSPQEESMAQPMVEKAAGYKSEPWRMGI